jgi:hypothetical protein
VGVSYSAKIVVGLPFCDIPNAQELLDEDKISDFGYYYDCNEEDRVVGIQVASSGSYSYAEIDLLNTSVASAAQGFYEITGLDGKSYLTVCSQ